MPLYSVPITILTTVQVFAPNPSTARTEARRYAEAMEQGGHFKDGWNDTQRAEGRAIIDDVSPLDVEHIELEEIETMPQRWVVVPQEDLNADLSPESGTRFEPCDEERATSFGVFVRFDCEQTSELVEDYPTRAAAGAAVMALEAGQPAPSPDDFPEGQETPIDIAAELAEIVEAMLVADARTDAPAHAKALQDGALLLARIGISVPADGDEEPAADPLDIIRDGVALLDTVSDAITDDGRCFVYLADGRTVRVTAEVVGG